MIVPGATALSPQRTRTGRSYGRFRRSQTPLRASPLCATPYTFPACIFLRLSCIGLRPIWRSSGAWRRFGRQRWTNFRLVCRWRLGFNANDGSDNTISSLTATRILYMGPNRGSWLQTSRKFDHNAPGTPRCAGYESPGPAGGLAPPHAAASARSRHHLPTRQCGVRPTASKTPTPSNTAPERPAGPSLPRSTPCATQLSSVLPNVPVPNGTSNGK